METVFANDGTGDERVAYGRLLWVGPLAGLSAAAANAVVFLIASLLIMHVVAAVLIVGVLTTLARKDRRERVANGKPERRRSTNR